ncbi:hypothetical protein LXL04_024929 [Taraxacum kok-saghyz]
MVTMEGIQKSNIIKARRELQGEQSEMAEDGVMEAEDGPRKTEPRRKTTTLEVRRRRNEGSLINGSLYSGEN